MRIRDPTLEQQENSEFQETLLPHFNIPRE